MNMLKTQKKMSMLIMLNLSQKLKKMILMVLMRCLISLSQKLHNKLNKKLHNKKLHKKFNKKLHNKFTKKLKLLRRLMMILNSLDRDRTPTLTLRLHRGSRGQQEDIIQRGLQDWDKLACLQNQEKLASLLNHSRNQGRSSTFSYVMFHVRVM